MAQKERKYVNIAFFGQDPCWTFAQALTDP